MRNTAPHRLTRYRWGLLLIALASWAVAFAALVLFKGSKTVPVESVVASAGLLFVWFNGAFWAVEFLYPHVAVEPNRFASRMERASHGAQVTYISFFALYALASIYATVACARIALGG
jgi:hypothetical protein